MGSGDGFRVGDAVGYRVGSDDGWRVATTNSIVSTSTVTVTPIALDTVALNDEADIEAAVSVANTAGVAAVVAARDTTRLNDTSHTTDSNPRRRAGDVTITKSIMFPPSSDSRVAWRAVSWLAVGGASAAMLTLAATVTVSANVGCSVGSGEGVGISEGLRVGRGRITPSIESDKVIDTDWGNHTRKVEFVCKLPRATETAILEDPVSCVANACTEHVGCTVSTAAPFESEWLQLILLDTSKFPIPARFRTAQAEIVVDTAVPESGAVFTSSFWGAYANNPMESSEQTVSWALVCVPPRSSLTCPATSLANAMENVFTICFTLNESALP